MNVMAGRATGSGLNPNAPLFVPQAYRAVEEFSDQWWQLVESSAWFRDYWLHESFRHDRRKQGQQQQQQREKSRSSKNELTHESFEAFLPDADVLFHGYQPQEEEKEYWSTRDRWDLGGQVAADVATRRRSQVWSYGEKREREKEMFEPEWVGDKGNYVV